MLDLTKEEYDLLLPAAEKMAADNLEVNIAMELLLEREHIDRLAKRIGELDVPQPAYSPITATKQLIDYIATVHDLATEQTDHLVQAQAKLVEAHRLLIARETIPR